MLCYDIVKREIDQLQAFVCKVILILYKYSKTCLKQPLKTDKTKILMTNGSLIQVESIAECSPWPALSDNWP